MSLSYHLFNKVTFYCNTGELQYCKIAATEVGYVAIIHFAVVEAALALVARAFSFCLMCDQRMQDRITLRLKSSLYAIKISLTHAITNIFYQKSPLGKMYQMRKNALAAEGLNNPKLVRISHQNLILTDLGGYEAPSKGTFNVLSGGEALEDSQEVVEFSKGEVYGVTIREASNNNDSQTSVDQRDCLMVASEEVQKGNKVAVICFAGSQEPGGGFLTGTLGQEESIIYRSDLGGWMLLQNNYQLKSSMSEAPQEHEFPKYVYPLSEKSVHIPGVTVFRDTEYQLIDDPFQIGIILSSALSPYYEYARNDLGDYQEVELVEKAMKARIYNQLLAARDNEYDVVIAGAFGCGAFLHPAGRVARMYREIIDVFFPCSFSRVIFSVLGESSQNYQAFSQTFNQNSI